MLDLPVMRVRRRLTVVGKEFAQFTDAEVTFDFLHLVNHATAERLLVCLALKHLLFDGARLLEEGGRGGI